MTSGDPSHSLYNFEYDRKTRVGFIATGDAPLVAIISFSAADRRTENLEDTDDIA